MMELIFSWVKRLVVFLMFSTVLVNISGKNGKYIKTIAGFITIMLVAEPLIKLIAGVGTFDFELKKSLLSYESYVPDYIFEKAEAFTLDEFIKENTAAIVNEYGLELCDCEVKRSSDKILSISCVAATLKESGENKVSDMIAPVYINVGNATETEKDENSKEKEIEKSIKKELADFYNIDEDNIYIYIREGR